MKKVLALVLAVMMLSTMAFATYNEEVVDKGNNVNFGGRLGPGDKMYVYKDMGSVTDSGNWIGGTDADVDPSATWNAKVTSANYTVTAQKWTEGKDLLAGVEFDDNKNQLVIKLKEDYTLKQPKSLKGTFTLKGKGKGGTDPITGKAVRPNNIDVSVNVTVGNFKQSELLDVDNDLSLTAAGLPDNTVVKFDATGTDNYGTVVISCADAGDTEVTFRGYKNDELFLHNNEDADSALLKAYADEDAEISFLNFVANQTLNSTATVRFYKDEDTHVYVMKDGKLASEVKWDDDEGCFILKTRTLGSYVFSDKALPFTTTSPSNPDTGANDVVGIATALASVALVSAAAVSLKK